MWKFLKKNLKIALPRDPAVSFLGKCPKDSILLQGFLHIVAALFIIARKWNQARRPLTNEWVTQVWAICTMEFPSTIRKNEIMEISGNEWNWRILN